MSAATSDSANVASSAQEPTASVPVLGEGFQESTPTASQTGAGDKSAEAADTDGKPGKRHFWQIGKKKDDKKKAAESPPTSNPASTLPVRSTTPVPAGSASPRMSPGGGPARVVSPASSQIFERNVQEDVDVSAASTAIPAHMATDNHIPPVLDASSIALTDDHLTPDNVEIVTHAAHQPASVAVTAATTDSIFPPIAATISGDEHSTLQAQAQLGTGSSSVQHTALSVDGTTSDEAGSNYGSLDATDVRRLSFISFADIVHAESGDHSSMRESTLLGSPVLASTVASPAPVGARSPSPLRSPISPPLSASSGSPRFGAVDGSPARGAGSPRPGVSGLGLGVPHTGSPPGELSIETMTQALRKTGSGDLSGARSGSGEDGEMDRL